MTRVGRVKSYESIVKGENIPEPGVPASFKVLLKEMQSLGSQSSRSTTPRRRPRIRTAGIGTRRRGHWASTSAATNRRATWRTHREPSAEEGCRRSSGRPQGRRRARSRSAGGFSRSAACSGDVDQPVLDASGHSVPITKVSEEIRLFGGPCQVLLKRVLPSARFLSAVEKYSRARSPAFFPAGEGVLAMAVGMISIRF